VEFEWQPEKAERNLRAHGVAFTEAMTVFGDPLEVTISDAAHSEEEFRFLSLGTSEAGRQDPNHQRTGGNSRGTT
jgi:uncharacterized DUF497 family protein